MIGERDSVNSCSIALPHKFAKLWKFDNIEKFMSMGGKWKIITGGSGITWAKPMFLSILRSSDFNFDKATN